MKTYKFIKYPWMSYGLINGWMPLWKRYKGGRVEFTVKIDESWFIKSTGNINTQKIFGIKLGQDNDDSIRLGFKPHGTTNDYGRFNRLEMSYYCHVGGPTNYEWHCRYVISRSDVGNHLVCVIEPYMDKVYNLYLNQLSGEVKIQPQKGRFSGLYDEDNKQPLSCKINLL